VDIKKYFEPAEFPFDVVITVIGVVITVIIIIIAMAIAGMLRKRRIKYPR